ncbi:hypothetical protein BLS_000125 [Venturia inaequalis]|uniref:Uncharacterized protein n=1 Tax=Venturia inaequalis TaxID=5025 RepID=A0A8H3YM12_VENIN|nr:hypothetical protein BLS_000125 [Venturia inaequalis]
MQRKVLVANHWHGLGLTTHVKIETQKVIFKAQWEGVHQGQDAKSCAAANVVSSSSAKSSSTFSSSSASKTNISSSTTPSAYNYTVPSSYSVKNVTSAGKVTAAATGTYPIASTSAKAPVQFEGVASSLGTSISGLMVAALIGVTATLY